MTNNVSQFMSLDQSLDDEVVYRDYKAGTTCALHRCMETKINQEYKIVEVSYKISHYEFWKLVNMGFSVVFLSERVKKRREAEEICLVCE